MKTSTTNLAEAVPGAGADRPGDHRLHGRSGLPEARHAGSERVPRADQPDRGRLVRRPAVVERLQRHGAAGTDQARRSPTTTISRSPSRGSNRPARRSSRWQSEGRAADRLRSLRGAARRRSFRERDSLRIGDLRLVRRAAQRGLGIRHLGTDPARDARPRRPICSRQEDVRRGVMLTLVSDVAADYFKLLELDRELAIAQESVAHLQEDARPVQSPLQGRQGQQAAGRARAGHLRCEPTPTSRT